MPAKGGKHDNASRSFERISGKIRIIFSTGSCGLLKEENSGSVALPYAMVNGELFIGLITQLRPVIRDRNTDRQGATLTIEAPRGFRLGVETPTATALRELGAENPTDDKKPYPHRLR